MKILFDYSADARIKELKIIADNDQEEQHLMEVRDNIIELLGSSAAVEQTEEGLDGGSDQNDPETKALFDTGGC